MNHARLPDHHSAFGDDGEFQFQYAYCPDHTRPKEWSRLCDHYTRTQWFPCSDDAFGVNTVEEAVRLFNKIQQEFSANSYSYRFRVVDKSGRVVIPDEWLCAVVKDGEPHDALA